MNFNNHVNIIKDKMSRERFTHSLRVADTALEMARGRTVDREKLYLAALLHDYAKDLPPQELLDIARENGLLTCRAEEVQPNLLHGPVGAWLCSRDLLVDDAQVLQAIRFHTTGHAGMSLLDAIIYLADLIEPAREFEGAAEIRRHCAQDIWAGLFYAFDATLLYVIKRGLLIHPYTVEARNWLLDKNNMGELYEE